MSVSELKSSDGEKVIVALDIGTTSVRSFVFNSQYEVIGKARFTVILRTFKPGQAEIEPELFFKSIVKVIKDSIADANLKPKNVLCLGICTQRGTFTTFDKVTGRSYHSLITWKDTRSETFAEQLNNGFFLKSFRLLSNILFLISRKKHYKEGGKFKVTSFLVATRLLWAQKYFINLKKFLGCKNTIFGMLDSWLLYKLKIGTIDFNDNLMDNFQHLGDISNSSVTGFFDPYTKKYAWWALWLFSIQENLLPRIVGNNFDFGYTHPSVFGIPVKIAAITTDQSASMWGNCCFKLRDVKITIGTGAIISINTGNICDSIGNGFYPLVAWMLSKKDSTNSEVTYVLEKSYADSGMIIQWAQKVGLFTNPTESSDIAFSVPDTGNVFFIPINYELGNRITGFHGVTQHTTKAHLVRAIFEGIAFTISDMFLTYQRVTNSTIDVIRIDGGIASNDFLCQTLSTLCKVIVERAASVEMTAQGLAYLCAYNCGLLKNYEEISKHYKVGKVFRPDENRGKLLKKMASWKSFYVKK